MTILVGNRLISEYSLGILLVSVRHIQTGQLDIQRRLNFKSPSRSDFGNREMIGSHCSSPKRRVEGHLEEQRDLIRTSAHAYANIDDKT
jgi:hypothetical protein